MSNVRAQAEAARKASRVLAASSDDARRRALNLLAARLESADIGEANALDLAKETAPVLRARLKLDADKLETLADGCRQLANREDPKGRTLRSTVLDDGLHLYQVTSPLGVIACIFESRPDAVVQIASLAIRTGNAVLLKGGSEASNSNEVLVAHVRAALQEAGLPADAVSLLAGREEVSELLAMDDLVDLIIPRGGNALVKFIQANTNIAVLGHAAGVCHIYIDRSADREKALRTVLDAKLDYPAACNAVETVLVHRDQAGWVPQLVDALQAAGVTIHQGGAADFHTEYGEAQLSLAIVEDLEAATAHIATYGSGHTEAIITEDPSAMQQFVQGVDAAGVFVNASTRFADGYRYGLGAEVGVSTNKIHARGPVGLEGLLTYRWILVGDGHAAATYRTRAFRHDPSDSSFSEQMEAWSHV